jgi:hypothetical protein
METFKVKVRCGADPEVFLINNQGKFLSIIGKIGANKHNPKQIEGMEQGFTLQEDNVALEFGIPPATTAKEFSDHIERVMKAGLSTLPNTMFSTFSCVKFPKDQMKDPEAFVFGCEPDFNAWTGAINDKPQPPHPFMRTAGGHIHIETQKSKDRVIQACDLFLGIPSVLMDSAGGPRRSIYGGAGANRPKPYGVEYRTLSNFWIFKPELREWAWRGAERAEQEAEQLDLTEFGQQIQMCINQGNKRLAEKFVKKFNLEVL